MADTAAPERAETDPGRRAAGAHPSSSRLISQHLGWVEEMLAPAKKCLPGHPIPPVFPESPSRGEFRTRRSQNNPNLS